VLPVQPVGSVGSVRPVGPVQPVGSVQPVPAVRPVQVAVQPVQVPVQVPVPAVAWSCPDRHAGRRRRFFFASSWLLERGSLYFTR
jgi:hypothetical protein